MMKCKQARQMISPYIDDELGLGEKKAVALHIQDCAACREEMEETRAVHKMFASTERFSAPYGFATRVLANLEEKDARLRRLPGFRSFFLRTAEVAFALAVMSIGIISGNLLLADRTPPYGRTTVQESFSLDLFQATPPDSVGGIYLAFVGGKR